MKKISLTILSAAVLFLFSCEDNSQETHKHEEAEVHNHDDHAGHDHAGHDHADHSDQKVKKTRLVLNDGKKWPVSETLMAVAKEMSSEVDGFAKSDKKDYHALAETLNDGISKLINKCELPDGEAHENLHEWLYPYMGNVKELKKSANAFEGEVAFLKIQDSFKTFNQYFE